MDYLASPRKGSITIEECCLIFDDIEQSGGVGVSFDINLPLQFSFSCGSFIDFYKRFDKTKSKSKVNICNGGRNGCMS